MDQPRIVGVCLVRNEENFIGWALANVAAFCDELLVMDNLSNDYTRSIVDALAVRHRHIRVITVEDANRTHAHVADLAGSRTWVFGVDGDEIYDPAALARLRRRLLSGAFDHYWRLYGHTVHTRSIDFAGAVARGYIPPRARSITKLYNFAAISSWQQPNHERLHGKDMVFRPGYNRQLAYNFWEHENWEQSDCRCLHLCFAPRSRLDGSGDARANPIKVKRSRQLLKRLGNALLRRVDSAYERKKNYKYRHYALGDVISAPIPGFGRPRDLVDLSAHLAQVDAMFDDDSWLPDALAAC